MRAKILLAATIALTATSCGDDGFSPKSAFLDPTSPENVLNNLAACYNEMSYEQVAPIVDNSFTFIFWSEDVGGPPSIADVWYLDSFLDAMHCMLGDDVAPCDSLKEIKDVKMVLELCESPDTTNFEGAPPGTVQGRANMYFIIETVNLAQYAVRSQPYFYFVPDDSKTDTEGVTWRLWRVEDAANLDSPSCGAADGRVGGSPLALPADAASGRDRAASVRSASTARNEDPDPGDLPVEHVTWGQVLSWYSRPCN